MLFTYHSNRLENLTDRLATLISEPLRSPFEPELIIVQSNGMARWLSLQLAERLGVCTNVRFPFPGAFLWELFRRVLKEEVPMISAFEPAVLVWRLMALLADLKERDLHFEPLRSYLQDGDGLRRFELAWQIANVFDQYLVYRPDWIMAWERGEEDHWQAQLWRHLVSSGSAHHRVRLLQRFLQTLDAGRIDPQTLPQRISLIGISTLPPVYLEIFARLGQLREVHLFLLNPCREYWGDIVAERDIARRGADVDPEQLYLEVGNSLLASLGKQGRDFIDLIQAYPCAVIEDFTEPEDSSLLSYLQRDILALRHRGTADHPPLPVRLDDRSVQVHACHSPMRELEVLYDQLLDLFQQNPDLQPAEVIVMTPDIDAYGPYIEAVFATAEGERFIPFSIADRPVHTEYPLVDTFVELLDMPGSRFTTSQVLALLESEAVRQCFGFNEDDLALVHRWVRESGIRWGIDSANRASLNLPATREHTWRIGLDRLLLGYALPGENWRLLEDILPYDEVEGTDAQRLGRLQAFTEAVFSLEKELIGDRTLSAWGACLQRIVERFLASAEREEGEVQLLRTALEKLVQYGEQAGFSDSLPLAVVKSALRRELAAAEGEGGRFFSGGVTFCAMVPMRSIPFRVVCLIGMNADRYPRPHRSLGFDLMARNWRRGDRSRRNDDRYLFLEALLSARRCLYISYVGNDIHDNSIIPPSILVSELLDTIDLGFRDAGDGNRIRDRILTRHPLQPFSRRYFSGTPKLVSYSRELAEASRLAGRGEREPLPFITTALPEPDDGWCRIELIQLIRFFANPSRYLLRQRLKIDLEKGQEQLETREPFAMDDLAGYALRERMLSLRLAGMPLSDTFAVLRGEGRLPHGRVGECVFEREYEEVERFSARLGKALPADSLQPLEVDLVLGKRRLTGWLSGVSRQGLVGYRLAKVGPKDCLELWVRHLVLNVLAPEGVQRISHWLGRDREVMLLPVIDPLPHLQDLLDCYWRGLCWPLPFFPKSAFAYVQALAAGKTDPEGVARREWQGNDYHRGECEDHYYQLAFRGSDPLQGEFPQLAQRIFRPLLEHIQA